MTAAAPTKPRRRRRWSFVLTALSIGFVLAALLVELAFRVFWRLPPWLADFQQAGLYVAAGNGDPVLRPGYRGTLRIGDARVTTVHVDGLGLRVPEGGDPEPGGVRILMVGDSLVFGYGVDGDETLPARVQSALRDQGLAATVGNAGVPGYGSSHAVSQMARLAEPFAADAFVVCGFLGNDAVDDLAPRRGVYAGVMLDGDMARLVATSWRTRLAFRSRAALWLESWILVNRPEWSPRTHLGPDPEAERSLLGLPPQRLAGLFLDVGDEQRTWVPGTEPVIPRTLAKLRESLQRAADIAGGRPLWFVVLPTSWQVDEQKRVATLRQWQFDPLAFPRGLAQRRWTDVATELGITALDATPILAAAGPVDDLFLADGGHFDVEGNAVVGEWLAGELARRLRAEPSGR